MRILLVALLLIPSLAFGAGEGIRSSISPYVLLRTTNTWTGGNTFNGWTVFNGSMTINGICVGCGGAAGYPNLLITDGALDNSDPSYIQLNQLTVTGDMVVFGLQ